MDYQFLKLVSVAFRHYNSKDIIFSLSFTDRISNKCRLYNFDQVGKDRAWLKDILLSDSSTNESDLETQTEEGINELLYLHRLRKKYQEKFYENPKVLIRGCTIL